MPIPKTRADLVRGMHDSDDKLAIDLARVTPSVAKDICVDDGSIVDLLTVRTRSAQMVVTWIEAGKAGDVPSTPAPGYRWSETPRLNADIIAAAPRRSWARVQADLHQAHHAVLQTVHATTDVQRHNVGVFVWAGKWPLTRWISISTTTGYRSARKYIRAALRQA